MENWRKYLTEATRTSAMLSLIERGLYFGINELSSKIVDTSNEYGPQGLGVISLKFASESGLKKDVKLQVLTNLYPEFYDAPIVNSNNLSIIPNKQPWDLNLKNSQVIEEFSLNKNQIKNLDKRGFVNGMKFISIAFVMNDMLYASSVEGPGLPGLKGAAIDSLEFHKGNQFKDSTESGNMDLDPWLQGVGDRLGKSFSIVSVGILPQDRNKFRSAFSDIIAGIDHELEHSLQTVTGKEVDLESGQHLYGSRQVLGAGTTLNQRVEYLTMPDEAEAHVAQFYRLQQRKRGDWITLAKSYLQSQFEYIAQRYYKHLEPQEAQMHINNSINTVLIEWIKWAEKRFPKAVIGDERPLPPKTQSYVDRVLAMDSGTSRAQPKIAPSSGKTGGMDPYMRKALGIEE